MKHKLLAVGLFVASFAGMAAVANAQTSGPTTPTNISAVVTASNQVYISWSPSTDSLPIIGYYVYREGQLVADTPGELFYTDNAPAGYYTYTITAYDSAGNFSPQSTPSSLAYVQSDTIAPTAPTGLTDTISSTTVNLSWNPSTDNIAVVGYYIYRNHVKISTDQLITGTTFTDTGLAAGYSYTYVVVAYDAVGNTTASSPLTVTTILDTAPPSVPTGLSAVSTSSNQVALSWRPSYDNVSVAGYNIYRSGSIVGTSASTTYVDYGVSPQTNYQYQVSAYDEVGNTSQPGIPVNVYTPAPDTTPPSIPNGLSANLVSTSEIDLSWQSSTDNVGVAGYYIYQDGSEIGATASTTYQVFYLATSTTYEFAVKAYDAAGNISAQTSLAATTLAQNPVVSTPTTTPAPPITYPTYPTTPPMTPPIQPTTTTFTTALYYGLRSAMVTTLQEVLISDGYLGPNYATGFFGSLTQAAVQKFQCAKSIVCYGTPTTTGYGYVGVRTRAALNSN